MQVLIVDADTRSMDRLRGMLKEITDTEIQHYLTLRKVIWTRKSVLSISLRASLQRLDHRPRKAPMGSPSLRN